MRLYWREKPSLAGPDQTPQDRQAHPCRHQGQGNAPRKPEYRRRSGERNSHRKAAAEQFAANVLPLILPLKAQGASLRKIAGALNERRIETARGGIWAATQVVDILRRAG